MKRHILPIILAGGGGTRLWPLSRGYYPKQFLSLIDEDSMLQKTLKRLHELETADEPIVITNEEQRFLVAENARLINQRLAEIILEPVGRNTAPAITSAALRKSEPETLLLVMPSDHIILNNEKFCDQIMKAAHYASQDFLVTFGIQPKHPETGYGYINTKNALSDDVFEINEFVEKPSLELAEKYIKSGHYFWNSGLFVFKAKTWLNAIKDYQPDMYTHCQNAVEKGKKDGDFFRLDESEFSVCPDDSIDYAVMEKISTVETLKGALVTLDAGWSDIGSWSSVWDLKDKDENSNALYGDVVTVDSNNSLIHANHKLVATVGCHDMVIVETSDAVLVANKSESQNIKKVVNILKQYQREESLLHRKVYRPWGSYEGLEVGENFQVKRLIVSSGKKLSLQMHYKRAEHWVIVSGIATVTLGENVIELHENQSTFIPMGVKHRLENKQSIPLEVIEVQCGSYLGEDDIVRFDDDFGRVNEE